VRCRMWCWMEDFHGFTRNHYGRFPVKAVDWAATSKLFIDSSTSATRGTRYIWLENEEVKGMYYSFDVAQDIYKSSEKINEVQSLFEDHIEEFNGKVPLTAGEAFEVSERFVLVDSAAALVGSTITSLAILCVLAFMAMLAFTHSMVLSGIVVISTVIVILILAFFTTSIFKWKLGLIEVIAFIYFVGYALDYSLHIVYKYASDEALIVEPQPSYVPADKPRRVQRVQRTIFAMKAMGSATSGSAVTTSGSALFLIFCTLTLFVKLGAMCFTLTTASIIFALLALPAFLMLFGPLRPGKCRLCGCPNGFDTVMPRTGMPMPAAMPEISEPRGPPPRWPALGSPRWPGSSMREMVLSPVRRRREPKSATE